MSHKFLLNSSFHKFLEAIDEDLNKEEHAKGCAYCGGPLNRCDYPRVPMGVPKEFRQYYEKRYSLCCSQCRKRTTSQSVRFFGRRWFPEPLFLLVCVLIRNSINKCCTQLKQLFGITISQRTCKRWKRWWSSFTSTKFWKSVAGIIPLEHLDDPFPTRLFSLYSPTSSIIPLPAGKGVVEELDAFCSRQLVWVLLFLAPLTAGVLRAV